MVHDARRLQLQRVFIVALALGLTAVFLWMIRDFLGALFLAAVMAIFLMPVQRRLSSLMGGRPNITASLLLVLAVFLILLPLLAVLAVVAQQAVEVGQTVLPWLQGEIRNFRE